MHDAEGLDQVLRPGTLGQDAAGPRAQRLEGPALVVRGRHQDDRGPALSSTRRAQAEGPRGAAVHDQDVGPGGGRPHADAFLVAGHDERRLGGDDPQEAFAEQSVVGDDGDADWHHAGLRGPPGRAGGIAV